MKLHYLTPLTYPSNYANRLQVTKMSEAFSELSDFKLYIKKAKEGNEQIFADYDIKPYDIKEAPSPNLWPRSFWHALFLKKEIDRGDKDTVFYCRDVLLSIWLVFLSSKFKNNFFFENHSLGKFPDFMYRKVFENAKGIVSTNIRKADDITRKYGIPKNRIAVLGNGVDVEEFDSLSSKENLKKELALPIDKTVVLYAGTYTKEYGKETIEKLKTMMPEIEFVICTDKPRNIALKYMKASDILIAPYGGKDERIKFLSSPIKIKEYMATGNPVVVSRLPAIQEMVSDEEVYFAKADNAIDFMAKIREVLDNPREAKAKSQKAKEKVRLYTWDKRAETIINFIKTQSPDYTKHKSRCLQSGSGFCVIWVL